jgi:hypothetical protein
VERRCEGFGTFDRAVFRICIRGQLDASWSEYFAVESISVEVDEAGLCFTTLISGPVDQAALVGMINRLNGLGLPVVSVVRLPPALENGPSELDDTRTDLQNGLGEDE